MRGFTWKGRPITTRRILAYAKRRFGRQQQASVSQQELLKALTDLDNELRGICAMITDMNTMRLKAGQAKGKQFPIKSATVTDAHLRHNP